MDVLVSMKARCARVLRRGSRAMVEDAKEGKEAWLHAGWGLGEDKMEVEDKKERTDEMRRQTGFP